MMNSIIVVKMPIIISVKGIIIKFPSSWLSLISDALVTCNLVLVTFYSEAILFKVIIISYMCIHYLECYY